MQPAMDCAPAFKNNLDLVQRVGMGAKESCMAVKHLHIPFGKRPPEGTLRPGKVEAAKRRIKEGFYDQPNVIAAGARKLADALLKRDRRKK